MGILDLIRTVLGLGGSAGSGGSEPTDVAVTQDSGERNDVETPTSDAEPVEADASDESGGRDDVTDADETGDSGGSDGTAGDPVETVSGIGPAYSERLANAGVETVSGLLDADAGELAEATDISEKRINGWQERAAK